MRIRFLPLILIATATFGQAPATIKLADLQKRIHEKSENIQVINFWATWCGPCIKELPYFEKVTAENRPNVKVTLVSMDLDLNPDADKVHKFVARKNLRSEVLLLDERDPDSWINKIEKEWNGSLPATLVINQKTGQRKFVGKALQEGELEKLIAELEGK